MQRANRLFLTGYVWHITHRCQRREFLLKFARDRQRWRYWLFEAKTRFGLCVLNYTATSNHILGHEMRITDKSKSHEIGKDKAHQTESTQASSAPVFATELQRKELELAGSALRQELNALKQEIDKAGARLEKHPSIENLEVFRNLLSALLKKVTSNAYQVVTAGNYWDMYNRNQVIMTIDREAEELFDLVMNQQKGRIEIVKKIVRIQGLVVDLML